MLHPVVCQPIDADCLLPVKLNHVVAFAILVDAIQIVGGPGFLGRGVQQVAAKSHVGLVVAHYSQYRGQYIGLLGYTLADARIECAAGIVDDDRGAELVDAALVFRMIAHIGMVAREHEDGVLEPRFLAGFAEKAAQGMVGIADGLVDGHLLFGVHLFILFRHMKRMVARQREKRGHERLLHVAHLDAEILQERFVPDAPPIIVGGTSLGPAVGLEVFLTIAMLETGSLGETLKAQTGGRSPVEESRLIAQTVQAGRHAA